MGSPAPPTAPLGPSNSFFFAGDIFPKNGRLLWAVPRTHSRGSSSPRAADNTTNIPGEKKVFYLLAPTIDCGAGAADEQGVKGTAALLGLRLNLEESFGRAFPRLPGAGVVARLQLDAPKRVIVEMKIHLLKRFAWWYVKNILKIG